MAAARPRLVRRARARGIAPDAADDVAQETLLEAWRHLDDLYAPDGFDAWLNAIFRNVVQRYARASGLLARRYTSLPDPASLWDEGDGAEDGVPPDIADPLGGDPAEELDRQDLELLLDRALGHLPVSAREVVELCYLAETPQREAALRLGITIRSLEARLHRARRQLRQVLGGELRAEAQAFGLGLEERLAEGWRETRLWCRSCGQRRLQGAFEPLPGARVNLHLRCPVCSDEVNGWGHVPLDGLRSFRPAFKRVMRYASSYFLPGLTTGSQPCLACGAPQRPRIVGPDELGEPLEARAGLMVILRCGACGGHHADIRVADVLWSHPAAQRFMEQHPRSVTEPETAIEYLSRPAIRVRLTDVASAARLTLLVHPQTLHVLAALHD